MKDLVLVHGWGFGSAVWRPVLDALSPRFRIRLVDLPGYDELTDWPDDIAPGAVVCGWSLGALTAMRRAVAEPERIARLVLVGATPRFVRAADWPTGQPPALLEGFATGVVAGPAAALRRFAALVNQDDVRSRALTRFLFERIGEGIAEAAVLRRGLEELRDADLRAMMPRIAQPTLVVHGANDRVTPPAAAAWLAQRLPHARLELFEDAAHAPFLSDPQRFAALLVAFAHE